VLGDYNQWWLTALVATGWVNVKKNTKNFWGKVMAKKQLPPK
jgi:hypothetical protein